MNFRTQFPVLDNCTYLNTASSGILSRSIQQWRQQHDEEFVQQGSNFRLQQEAFLQDVREHVARFFNNKSANTFLIPNCSFACNTLLDGLSPEHTFLLIDNDYPSLTYPVVSRGFRYEYAEPDEHLEQNIADKIKTLKPSVLLFSMVQYTSGIRMDLNFIRKLKDDYPDLLIIADGTQYCGTEHFNFLESGVDVLVASGYKWMLGGYGNGFMLVKEDTYKHLYQQRSSSSLPKEVFLKNKNQWRLCFEPGHLDTFNFGTLRQSILFLEELGADFIEKRIRTIGGAAKKAFTDRHLLADTVIQRAQHSSIFNIQADAAMVKRIQEANIILSTRGEGLRVSFHFYNEEQDLHRLLEVIDSH